MVPTKFLDKIGNYSLNINGSVVKVKVADCEAAINSAISEFYSSSIVGMDYKTVIDAQGTHNGVLVLCGGRSGICLVMYMNYLKNKKPEVLTRLFSNPDNCFVQASKLKYDYWWVSGNKPIKSIEAGELAAQALNKPELKGSSFADVARAVGLSSTDLNSSRPRSDESIRVEQSYGRVLTPEQMKKLVVDAYACYKIGNKLLNST